MVLFGGQWHKDMLNRKVEDGSESFNASISLGSLFERLLSWDDSDASPIDPSQSPLARNLLSCVELNIHLLQQGLGKWQAE